MLEACNFYFNTFRILVEWMETVLAINVVSYINIIYKWMLSLLQNKAGFLLYIFSNLLRLKYTAYVSSWFVYQSLKYAHTTTYASIHSLWPTKNYYHSYDWC